MTKIRKLTAILLSAVLLVCCFSVQASAASSATAITSGKKYSKNISGYQTYADYKITAQTSGKLVIDLTSEIDFLYVYLYDSKENLMDTADVKATEGELYGGFSSITNLYANKFTGKFIGKLTYEIKKGTYYLRFENRGFDNSGKISFTAKLPSSSSSSGKISGIAVSMKVGGTTQLAAVSSGSSGSISWSSSNSSVATVSSSGKVTAKKKGTATITAKLGSSKATITIKVS